MGMCYRIGLWLSKFVFKIFYRHKVIGKKALKDKIKKQEGALIVANHSTFFDPPLVGASAPWDVHFMARDTLWKVPILGRIMDKLNTHPVVRGAANAALIKRVAQLIKEGNKVLIFPEGLRSKDGTIQPFKAGFILILEQAQCPLIPIHIKGAYKLWPRDKKFPRPFGKIECVWGNPISFETYLRYKEEANSNKDFADSFCEKVRQTVSSL